MRMFKVVVPVVVFAALVLGFVWAVKQILGA
jgi:hypothetical protein